MSNPDSWRITKKVKVSGMTQDDVKNRYNEYFRQYRKKYWTRKQAQTVQVKFFLKNSDDWSMDMLESVTTQFREEAKLLAEKFNMECNFVKPCKRNRKSKTTANPENVPDVPKDEPEVVKMEDNV